MKTPNEELLEESMDSVDCLIYNGDMLIADLVLNTETVLKLRSWILELEAQYKLGVELQGGTDNWGGL